MLPGALAGLSLLQDLPNYRHSRPTKIVEYMAHGVPVVTTPLPVAVELVESAGAGVVVCASALPIVSDVTATADTSRVRIGDFLTVVALRGPVEILCNINVMNLSCVPATVRRRTLRP